MKNKKLISVVVPVYYNQDSLMQLFKRLEELVLSNPEFDYEFIFVDDFSGDNSYSILSEYLDGAKNKVKLVRLSKNHGSFVASLAGLTKCEGDSAVIISADLQDPPEFIADMAAQWDKGYEVVIAARNKRGDSLIIRLFARIYYYFFRKFALKDMPENGFDFVLFDRKIINIICDIKEKNSSLMGLILWSGFKRKILHYDRKTRPHGKSMWTFTKKFKYFVDSFIAFSFVPIRLATLLGFMVSILGFLYSLYIIYEHLFRSTAIRGITTLIALVLFIGGLQLIILGIIGEYLWRILDETRKRPTFIIDEYKHN